MHYFVNCGTRACHVSLESQGCQRPHSALVYVYCVPHAIVSCTIVHPVRHALSCSGSRLVRETTTQKPTQHSASPFARRYKYTELMSNNYPRFPIFISRRDDIDWSVGRASKLKYSLLNARMSRFLFKRFDLLGRMHRNSFACPGDEHRTKYCQEYKPPVTVSYVVLPYDWSLC